jgi:hypothetical protein
MAVTNRDLRNTGPLNRQAMYEVPVVRQPRTATRMPYLLTIVLCLVTLALVSNSLSTWGQGKLDDIRYGRPRTTHLSAFVGHNDGEGIPTQFIAVNLNRRVTIFEIPGGDVSKTRTLTGPYLFGVNEDLTPIGLRLEYINDDKKPDLVVSVKSEEIIYVNEEENFRLMTPEEREAFQNRLSATDR